MCPLNRKSPAPCSLGSHSSLKLIKWTRRLQCQKPVVLTGHSTFKADVMGTKVRQRNKKAFKGAKKQYLTQHTEQMEVKRKMDSL